MGKTDEWFLHPLVPEWEREMVVDGMEIEKEEAKQLAKKGKLSPNEVVRWCSEGRGKRKIADKFNFKGKKVIEIGCGNGYYTQFVVEEANIVSALDYMVGNRENYMWNEFKKVMKGNKTWGKVQPIQSDARNIPSPDNSYDIATCASFFRDLYPQNVQKEIIEEMARVSEGLRVAVSVNKDLNRSQQNFFDQLELRKKAQKALDGNKKHWSHVPFDPSEVKSWFEVIGGIDHYEFLDPDLKGQWAWQVDYFIDEMDNSHPEKKELEEELERLNSDIGKYGCKRPTIMLIWA